MPKKMNRAASDQGSKSSDRWSLQDIATALDAELKGDAEQIVSGIATLSNATMSEISFLANPAYEKQLASTKAAAVIVHPHQADLCPVAAIVVDNPYVAYAKVSHLFNDAPKATPGAHPSAIIHETAVVDSSASIGANAIIEAGSAVKRGAIIGPGSVVGENSVVGAHSHLHANVTLYHSVSIGERCVLHSGSVIGSDGFGFANEQGKWKKIAQLGGVTIGNFVDVGANTAIDRGAIEDTQIHDNVILDNHIQIGHNVIIGEGTAIAGCTGIAGSTKIGKNCTIAGAVAIAGHLKICEGVHVTMRSVVTRSISESGSYSSGTAMSSTREWRKNAARFRQLDQFVKRLQTVERFIKKI